MSDVLLERLFEWLRIPSVSSGAGDAPALRAAAEWVGARVREAGGVATLVDVARSPLVVGELRAGADAVDPPTVMIYGHYDVQGAGPRELWDSDPFEPEIREGRIYARGASDDKGNFLPLLLAACRLAAAGELPVNVRVVVEGEEEIGSTSVADWVLADARGADCAVVFDSSMLDERTPALTLAARGMVQGRIHVRVAERDFHSGVYGGAVLNAVHVLHGMLAAVLPNAHGVLRDELRAGAAAPSEEELAGWAELPSGARELAAVGGRPVSAVVGEGVEFYRRTGADASLEVNGIAGGDPAQLRTIVPAEAVAQVSLRLAPGQRGPEIAGVLERLLRAAAPAAAELEIELHTNEPALFDPRAPALRLAREALGRACGVDAALMRTGGSLPVLAAFSARGIPAIVTGFALPADRIHAPNESYRVTGLRQGERAAEELLRGLGALASARPG